MFARFRITPIIGFILIGVLVGPFGLGALVVDVPWLYYFTISDPEALTPFADFGIVLLLFAIGLELSFSRLKTMRKLVFGLGALEVVLVGIVLAIALALSGYALSAAVTLGLALAFSSTAIVLPISGTTSQVGQAALSMLLFEGIALVPIIFVLGALAPNASADGWGDLANTLWQGGLVIVVLLLAGRYLLPGLFAQAARTKSPELFLAASLLVVIGASLATTLVGLSPIVGALVAGVLIAETDYSPEVAVIMEPFKGLALGVFLITIGMSINMATVLANIVEIVFSLVLVLTFKAVVTTFLLRLMGARRGTSVETGIVMASPSEDTLIILAAASAATIISPQTAQFWQIVTALGLTVTPMLAKLGKLAARRAEAGNMQIIDEDDGTVARTIIVGGGRVGRLVADMMKMHGKPYEMVDSNPDLIALAKREGYRATFGDAARGDTLERLGVENAPAVVLTMDEPVLAQRLVTTLRREHPDLRIVARARDPDHAAAMYRAGASHAVPETLEASLQLSEAVLVDIGVAMGPVIASIHAKRDEFREQLEREGGLSAKPQLKTGSLREREA